VLQTPSETMRSVNRTDDSRHSARNARPAKRRSRRWWPAPDALESRALLSTYTWTGKGDDGNWEDPGNWVTDAGDPDATEVPGIGDAVVIPANSGTITLVAGNGADSLTCGFGTTLVLGYYAHPLPNASRSVLEIGEGGLSLDGTLEVENGSTLAFAGTQTIGGSGNIVLGPLFVQSNGTSFSNDLDAVGANGVSSAAATLTIGPKMTIQSQGGAIGGDDIINEGLISSSGETSIGYAPLQGFGGVSVDFLNGFDNQGTIQATGHGALAIASSDTLSTEGTIDADGGTVTLSGSNLENGTVEAGPQSSFVAKDDGQIVLECTLENTGGTIYLDDVDGSCAMFPYEWNNTEGSDSDSSSRNAAIQGGEIFAVTPGSGLTGSNKGLISGDLAVLDGVTLAGDFEMKMPSTQLTIQDGLTLDGSVTLNNASDLRFSSTQTLGGTGQIVFGPNEGSGGLVIDSPYVNSGDVTEQPPATLTLGSGITVEGGVGAITQPTPYSIDTLINEGVISSGGQITTKVANFVNQGTMTCTGDGTMAISFSFGGSLQNEGVIAIQSGGTMTITSLINRGTILLSPGKIVVEDFRQTSTGALEIGIGGLSSGTGYGQVDAESSPILDGSLDISLLGNFTPASKNRFSVFADPYAIAQPKQGTKRRAPGEFFSSVTGLSFPDGGQLVFQKSKNGIVLAVGHAPAPKAGRSHPKPVHQKPKPHRDT
jgi:hypothetical protein